MDNTRWFTFINYLLCRWQEAVIPPLEYIGNGVGAVRTTLLGALINACQNSVHIANTRNFLTFLIKFHKGIKLRLARPSYIFITLVEYFIERQLYLISEIKTHALSSA